MNCPACAQLLSEHQAGGLGLRICRDGCGGVWFDTFEMDQLDQDTEALSELLLRPRERPATEVDPMSPRLCPRCESIALKRVLLSPGSVVHVHECPSCDGCWLDEAELAKLHDERFALIESGKIQPGGAFDLIHYLYEVRTGKRNR